MADITLTVAEYLADGASQPYGPGDTVTIQDTSTALEGLSAVQIAGMVTNNVDLINATNDVLSWNVAQWDAALPGLAFDGDDFLILSDTGANIAAASATLIGQIASAGGTLVSPTDGSVSLTLAQYNALGGMSIDADAVGTLSDTGANLASLTVGQIGALSAKGIDGLNATDDALSLTVAQYAALGAIDLAAGDLVTLADTGANLAAVENFGALEGDDVDVLDATDNALSLTAAQFSALGEVGLTAGDVVTVSDTGAAIEALDFALLNSKGVDAVSATDGDLQITTAQYNARGSVNFTAEDNVSLSDTGANLAALGEFGDFADENIDELDATDDILALTVAQTTALGAVTVAEGDLFSVRDSAANLEAMTVDDIGDLIAAGADSIDATGDGATVNLTVDQANALGALTLAAGDDFVLADDGETIAALSAAEITALGTHGFDSIDSTSDALTISVAQYQALGTVALTTDDTVTLSDTAANILALSNGQMSYLLSDNIDTLSTDDALALTVTQYNALAGITFEGAGARTIVDTGANIATLDFAALDADGFVSVNATDDVLAVTVAQYDARGMVDFTAGDAVTLSDGRGNLEALDVTLLGQLAADNIDIINSTNDVLKLDASQLDALGDVGLSEDDIVTLLDSATNLEGLSDLDLAAYGEQGVDLVEGTDDTVNFEVSQVMALLSSSLDLAAGTEFVLADIDDNIAGMSASQMGGLGEEGVDLIDATDDTLHISVAQLNAIGEVGLTSADVVTLVDSAANLEALSAETLGGLESKGVDVLDSTDDTLALTVAQFQALGEVGLTEEDDVTLKDTGANIAALSAEAMGNLAGDGIDIIDATDNQLTLTIDQYSALFAPPAPPAPPSAPAPSQLLQVMTQISLTAADVVTVADSAANLQALTGSELTQMSGHGIDVLDSTDGTLTFTASQASAIASSSITLTASDSVTLADTGDNIGEMSNFEDLDGDHFDIIDATDNVLSLTASRYASLGDVALTQADYVTLADTGAAIAALSTAQFAAMAADGVDQINATDNALALTVAKYTALFPGGGDEGPQAAAASVVLTGADVVTLRDTGSAIGALTQAQIAALAGNKIDAIDATNNALSLSVAQFNALGTVSLAAGDTVTLADTSANIQALSAAQLISLGGKGVDVIDTTDDQLTLTVAKYQNLGSVTLASGDTVTLSDTSGNLQGLTQPQIAALQANGVDILDATSDNLSLNVAKATSLNGVTVAAGDEFTVADSAANLQGLSAGDITMLATAGVDVFDATGAGVTVNFTAAQAAAMGSIHLVAEDNGVLVDTGANIAAMTAAALGLLDDKGIDSIDASDDAISFSVAQYRALDVTVTGADVITLSDTGAALADLTAGEMGPLGEDGVDKLDATDDVLSLSAAQLTALDSGMLTADDVVTITGSGADLAALSEDDLDSNDVDRLNATDNVLNITLAQAIHYGESGVALTQADLVTMTGEQGALQALVASDFTDFFNQGVDIISSDSDELSLSATQAAAIANIGLTMDADDYVEVEDTAANIQANLGALFGALEDAGIDAIDAVGQLDITVNRAKALGSVYFTASSSVTVLDTSAKIEAMTVGQLGDLRDANIDSIDATDDVLNLTFADYEALGLADNVRMAAVLDIPAEPDPVQLTWEDYVTLADTGANIAAIDSFTMAGFAWQGIDQIDASDDVLNLSVDQVQALLGSGELDGAQPAKGGPPPVVVLTANDLITITGSGEDFSGLSASDMSAIFAAGVDTFDMTGEGATFSLAQYDVLRSHGVFDTNETVGIRGGKHADQISGGREINVIYGLGGVDTLSGSSGNDTLIGGNGGDVLTGGKGADIFDFNKISESSLEASDVISDLNNKDTIDLRNIDAKVEVHGNQAFKLVSEFTHEAGQLTLTLDHGNTLIQGDVDGDGVADFQIIVSGDHTDFTNFVL